MKDSIWAFFMIMFGIIVIVFKINQQKFIESFLRRFAENASLGKTYVVEIYDINETPPKVSIKVSSTENGASEVLDFDLVNKVDAILETVY